MKKIIEQDGEYYHYNEKTKTYDELPSVIQDEGVAYRFEPSTKSYEEITESSLDKAAKEAKGYIFDVGEGLFKGISKGLELFGAAVDYPVAAPSRAAAGAMLEEKSPFSAFISQYAKAPAEAPTGKELAAKAGLSTEETLELGYPKMPPAISKEQLVKGEFPPIEGVKVSPAGAVGLGIDLASFAPTGAVLRGAGRAVKSAADILPGRPGTTIYETAKGFKETGKGLLSAKPSPQFERFKKIAEKNKIDISLLPEEAEFGPLSSVANRARSLREGQTGSAELAKFYQGAEQVEDRIIGEINLLSKGKAPANEVEAGNILIEGVKNSIDSLFNKVDQTYRGLSTQLNKSKGIESYRKTIKSIIETRDSLAKEQRFATGAYREQMGKTVEEINGLVSKLERWRAGKSNSYEDYVSLMQGWGKSAYKNNFIAPLEIKADEKAMQEIYRKMKDGFIDELSAQKGAKVVSSLEQNNLLMSNYFSDLKEINKIADVFRKGRSPEMVFRNTVVNGDNKTLDFLRRNLSESELDSIKGGYLKALFQMEPNAKLPLGKMQRALQRKEGGVLGLFSPEEVTTLDNLEDLLDLGKNWGQAILSTSRTGSSIEMQKGLGQVLQQDTIKRMIQRRAIESARGQNEPSALSELLKRPYIAQPYSTYQNYEQIKKQEK